MITDMMIPVTCFCNNDVIMTSLLFLKIIICLSQLLDFIRHLLRCLKLILKSISLLYVSSEENLDTVYDLLFITS